MRIHQTAIWRVRPKRPFSAHSAQTPPKLPTPTVTQAFLAHRSRLRQHAVLVTTRLYVPEVHSSAVTILPRSYWIPGSYVTSNSMSAGSNALPRLRTL